MGHTLLKSLVMATVLAAGSATALAQFGADPFALPAVADLGGDQTQSKTRMMPDGSFYVSWFDNRSGGYDVYLQKYNAAGVEQWPHNGILIADRTVSSTEDYDMRADSAGNAVLAFGQDTTTVKLVKVNSAGTIVFNTDVATGGVAGSRHTPRFCILSDGNYMVGWSESPVAPSAVKLQKVDANGAVTGGVTTLIEGINAPIPAAANKPYTLNELQPGENGSVIALWMRAFNTSGNASRCLRAQKFDANMVPLWGDASPTLLGISIFDPAGSSAAFGGGTYPASGGSLSIGAFPVTFEPDGQGGAVFSCYENSANRHAFVQQVSAAGVKRWNNDTGFPVTDVDPGFSKLSSSMTYNPANGDIIVSYIRSNTNQTQWGVGAQKIDAAGNLAWGPQGTTVEAVDTQQDSYLTTVKGPDNGCYVIGLELRSATTGVVQASRIDGAGNLAFNPAITEVCSELLGKSRLWAAAAPDGTAVFTFNNGNTAVDIRLGNIKPDGTFGPVAGPSCPADLGVQGGFPGQDGLLDNNDFIAFIDFFFEQDPAADMGVQGGFPGQDGLFDNNDFIAFIDFFFDGCS